MIDVNVVVLRVRRRWQREKRDAEESSTRAPSSEEHTEEHEEKDGGECRRSALRHRAGAHAARVERAHRTKVVAAVAVAPWRRWAHAAAMAGAAHSHAARVDGARDAAAAAV